MYIDYRRCPVTEGDGDTVKQAEKSVDRDGNSVGGRGVATDIGGPATYAGQLIGTAHV